MTACPSERLFINAAHEHGGIYFNALTRKWMGFDGNECVALNTMGWVAPPRVAFAMVNAGKLHVGPFGEDGVAFFRAG